MTSHDDEEIHDTVVQGLTVTKYALDGGNTEAASEAIRDTLSRAREIISALLDETSPLPGDLRRTTRAMDDITQDAAGEDPDGAPS